MTLWDFNNFLSNGAATLYDFREYKSAMTGRTSYKTRTSA